MMFNRNSLPGILMLGLCALAAIALLIEIFTDYAFSFDGPNWLGNGVVIVGIGLILLMSWRTWGSRIKRWRGNSEGGGGGQWPQNDVRGQRAWPKRGGDQTNSDASPTTADQPDPSDTSSPR